MAIPMSPLRDWPIPWPAERLTAKAMTLDTQKPQKPHFFHRNNAIAHARLNRVITVKTGNVQSGMLGDCLWIASLPSKYMSAVAELVTSMSINHAVRQPWRFLPSSIESSLFVTVERYGWGARRDFCRVPLKPIVGLIFFNLLECPSAQSSLLLCLSGHRCLNIFLLYLFFDLSLQLVECCKKFHLIQFVEKRTILFFLPRDESSPDKIDTHYKVAFTSYSSGDK